MKTALKRLSLAILISLALLQIPFIYRRWGFADLAERVADLKEASPTAVAADDKFAEHQGVFHVHSSMGGHSTGSFEEIVTAANTTGLDFVIMNEHWSEILDTADLTLNGRYGQTLFIPGSEVDTADERDRLLTVPGMPNDGSRHLPTPALIQRIRTENRLAFITYPEKFSAWGSDFDGIEVFSLHTNAQQASRLTALLDIVWSFSSYPEHVLMHYFDRPDENLRRFDDIASVRKISLIAGADAHSNIGFHLFGDEAGHKLLSFKLDEYSTIFKLVRQHVLLPTGQVTDRDSLLEAIKNGRSFIGLDGLADTTGFRFSTGDGQWTMGDEVDLTAASRLGLIASSPIPGRFVVYRNGETCLNSERTDNIAIVPDKPGAYRVEVYLDQLGPPYDTMPWIISNPIFVRVGL